MITQKLQSLIPAGAGTQVYEIWGSGWRVSFAVARDPGWLPDCLERGTSPGATLALGRFSPISRLKSCRAGLVRGFPPARE